MLLIWKLGEILVNAVYCQTVLRRKSIVCRETGRVETGGIYKTQEVKISGSLYQFSKSALYFLPFRWKQIKWETQLRWKCQEHAWNLITRKCKISISFHTNGDARMKKSKNNGDLCLQSLPFGRLKSRIRNRSTPCSFGKLNARSRRSFLRVRCSSG